MTGTGLTASMSPAQALSADDVRRMRNNVICSVLALTALGLIMAFSVSASRAADLRGGYAALARHAMHIGVALAAAVLCALVDYRLLCRYRWVLFAISMSALVLVLVPGVGTMRNGARRWFRVAGFSLQPSELAKLSLVVLLAGYVEAKGDGVRHFARGFLPAMAMIGVTSALVLVEPDFGTAALLGCVGTVVLIVAGARIRHVVVTTAPAFAALVVLICQSPTRLKRVLAFLDPWAYYDGAGYQVIQSLLALGNGGCLGRGLGASLQKLYFLPEAGSDFVLAVVGEEIGLAGCLGVVAAYALFVVEGMRLAGRVRDTFGSMLALGVTCTIGLQAVINVAVVTGSAPTKGIALPFISAGGSSLLFSMAGAGLLVGIARRTARAGADTGPAPVAELGDRT